MAERKDVDVARLVEQIREVRRELDAFEVAEREASKNTTYARNRLSALQKEFDAIVAAMKENAPWSTEWHSQRTREQKIGVD